LQLQEPDALIHQALARADLDAAPLTQPERELMTFVRLVTLHAYKTTDEDVERLREQGWTDPQIAECVYITALFAFFNRVADAFGLEDPNYFQQPPARNSTNPDTQADADPPPIGNDS
jgi:alkylhydroperoxidase family enzyme